ncbi:Reverse transcriptase-like, partial [Sesbania bispinosa]
VLVKEGVRWKIGDGRRIRVFRDPWLKNRSNSFITSSIPEGYEDLRVADLMDSNLACWRTNLIRSVFHPEEAVAILDTPLSSCSRDDELIWKLSRDEKFSVKSAYFHVSESLIDNSHLIVRGDWSLLWRLRINCAKLLMWRVLRGCLPVRTNLQRRGVKCPANVRYGDSGVGVIRVSGGNLSSVKFVTYESKREFVLMLWALWKRRNIKVWEGDLKSVQDTTWHAKETLEEWEKAHKRPTDMHDTQGWGRFIKAKSIYHQGSLSALEAEGMGLLEAINWLEELGVQVVDIELDCKVVVEAVHGDKTYVNELGELLNLSAMVEH